MRLILAAMIAASLGCLVTGATLVSIGFDETAPAAAIVEIAQNDAR